MVGTLVTFLFLGLLQLGIDFYVRNVVVACLADGARYGANANVASPRAAAAQANRELRHALGASYARAVVADPQPMAGGVRVVTITATVRLPLLAWFLPAGPTIHAKGEALQEPRQ
jgi:hypothetical protein